MKDKINTLRNELNKLLESKSINDDHVIKISHELDLLILEYYNNGNNKDGESIQSESEKRYWFIF